MAATIERFGRLDILVNNAGVAVTGVTGEPELDAAAVDRQFAINVGGVAAAVRAAAPLLREGGRIISIGSIAGTSALVNRTHRAAPLPRPEQQEKR